MKISVCLLLFLFVLMVSCNDDNETIKGTAVFGANYHLVNCVTNVDIFIDGEHIGRLETYSDSVPDCSGDNGLEIELQPGHYNYTVEIRPLMGTGCTEDVIGELNIAEGGCEAVFIDYFEVFAN